MLRNGVLRNFPTDGRFRVWAEPMWAALCAARLFVLALWSNSRSRLELACSVVVRAICPRTFPCKPLLASLVPWPMVHGPSELTLCRLFSA